MVGVASQRSVGRRVRRLRSGGETLSASGLAGAGVLLNGRVNSALSVERELNLFNAVRNTQSCTCP